MTIAFNALAPGVCAPPVDEYSYGYILYAGILAFIIPGIIIIVVQSLIWVKMWKWQGLRVGRAKEQVFVSRNSKKSNDQVLLSRRRAEDPILDHPSFGSLE